MNAYVVVFHGDATTGGYPIAITSSPESVRTALKAGLAELWSFAGETNDAVLRGKARGNIAALQTALADLPPSEVVET